MHDTLENDEDDGQANDDDTNVIKVLNIHKIASHKNTQSSSQKKTNKQIEAQIIVFVVNM